MANEWWFRCRRIESNIHSLGIIYMYIVFTCFTRCASLPLSFIVFFSSSFVNHIRFVFLFFIFVWTFSQLFVRWWPLEAKTHLFIAYRIWIEMHRTATKKMEQHQQPQQYHRRLRRLRISVASLLLGPMRYNQLKQNLIYTNKLSVFVTKKSLFKVQHLFFIDGVLWFLILQMQYVLLCVWCTVVYYYTRQRHEQPYHTYWSIACRMWSIPQIV